MRLLLFPRLAPWATFCRRSAACLRRLAQNATLRSSLCFRCLPVSIPMNPPKQADLRDSWHWPWSGGRFHSWNKASVLGIDRPLWWDQGKRAAYMPAEGFGTFAPASDDRRLILRSSVLRWARSTSLHAVSCLTLLAGRNKKQ